MGRAGPRKVHCDSLEFKRQAVKLSDLDGVEVQAVHFFRRFLAEVQKYPSLVSREHYMSLYLGREPWLIPGTKAPVDMVEATKVDSGNEATKVD